MKKKTLKNIQGVKENFFIRILFFFMDILVVFGVFGTVLSIRELLVMKEEREIREPIFFFHIPEEIRSKNE